MADVQRPLRLLNPHFSSPLRVHHIEHRHRSGSTTSVPQHIMFSPNISLLAPSTASTSTLPIFKDKMSQQQVPTSTTSNYRFAIQTRSRHSSSVSQTKDALCPACRSSWRDFKHWCHLRKCCVLNRYEHDKRWVKEHWQRWTGDSEPWFA